MNLDEYNQIKTLTLYSKCPRCSNSSHEAVATNSGDLCYYHAKIYSGLIDEPEIELALEEIADAPAYHIGYNSINMVWKIAGWLSSNEFMKTELFSEGLMHLMSAILSWQPTNAAFNTYAYRVVMNGIISFLRKQNRWDGGEKKKPEVVENTSNEEEENTQLDQILRKEEHNLFWAALDKIFPRLSELERAVMLHRVMTLNKETLRHVGERFDISRMTVLRTEIKLRKIIRKEMENGLFNKRSGREMQQVS